MKSMHLLLDEAEREWREEVNEDFPLRGDTPVVKSTTPNGRDWTFYTDLHKIFASMPGDEALQSKFKSDVTKYWDGEPEELAREVLHYLLFHELYHPIEAPFSVDGEDNDNKKIHQAIRRGLLRAQPRLSPLEQVLKVQASQNGVKDFVLDNRFALDNTEKGYVRKDVIPVWDFLELQNVKPETSFYSATRLLYGLLYGPQKAHSFFRGKVGSEGHEVAEKALSELIGKSVKLPKGNNLVDKAKELVGLSSQELGQEDLGVYVSDIRRVFAGEDRYRGIERFMKVLGPYVKQGMPQTRPEMQGEGAGGSPQSILQDLLDDMSPQEQQQFVDGLGNEKPQNLEHAASHMPPSDSRSDMVPSSEQIKNIDLLAAHEFYKRNHPHVNILGGNKIGESVVVGKRDYWHLKQSAVLTEDQLRKVNLRRIDEVQRKTRLPWLIDLKNGTFRLNEYELKHSDVKDIVYKDAHLDVPDIVEFYVDSSGSMGTADFKVNDGNSWDMLSYVLYGFSDALIQAGNRVNKQSNMRVHNFANQQVNSDTIPVNQFWQGHIPTLRTLFRPENGYDYENINIESHSDGQKRAYVVVTDGNLVVKGRTARESSKMKQLARNPNNHVVLFEIGGTYSLGNAVKGDKYVVYHPVHNKEEMLQAGLEVLLSK